MGSGGLWERLEGYLVTESFELRDEASGLAFGIAFAVVVAAEVAVGFAGGEWSSIARPETPRMSARRRQRRRSYGPAPA